MALKKTDNRLRLSVFFFVFQGISTTERSGMASASSTGWL